MISHSRIAGVGISDVVRLSDARDAVDKSIDLELLKAVILAEPKFDGKTEEGYDSGLLFKDVSMGDLVQYIKDNRNDLEAKMQKLVEQAEKEEAEQRAHDIEVSKVLITSGYNFEGYKITKYSGYISGDDVTQLNRDELYVNLGQNLSDALVKIRRQALKELKEAAYALGCNAVIAVDFDYITFEPETANATGGTTYLPDVVCVTANGTAVTIEKE